MWDRLWEVHRAVGFQGRAGMEQEGNKKYDNMQRNIIEIFLNFSSEYQAKLVMKKSWPSNYSN